MIDSEGLFSMGSRTEEIEATAEVAPNTIPTAGKAPWRHVVDQSARDAWDLLDEPKGAIAGTTLALLLYRRSYASPKNIPGLIPAPSQIVFGMGAANLITASFEIYENYTLYKAGKRSLDHAIADGLSDTLSAGLATYVGGSMGSLFISAAKVGLRVPLGPSGTALVAGVILSAAVYYGLSALKDAILK